MRNGKEINKDNKEELMKKIFNRKGNNENEYFFAKCKNGYKIKNVFF